MTEPNDPIEPEDYWRLYCKAKRPDAATILGGLGSTAVGAAVGHAAAPTIAGWFGANVATTSLGTVLSWLPASWLSTIGVTATVTTPVGWVIGSMAVCATLGFGLYKLAHSGGKQDERRRALGQKLIEKIRAALQARRGATPLPAPAPALSPPPPAATPDGSQADIEAMFRQLGEEGAIAPDKVGYFIDNLRSGRLTPEAALAVLREYGLELSAAPTDPAKAAAARAFTVMYKGTRGEAEPDAEFVTRMETDFGIERDRALQLYEDAPLDPDPAATAAQLAQVFNRELMQSACAALEETARSMQQGQAAFARFMQVRQALEREFDRQMHEIDRAGDAARQAIARL